LTSTLIITAQYIRLPFNMADDDFEEFEDLLDEMDMLQDSSQDSIVSAAATLSSQTESPHAIEGDLTAPRQPYDIRSHPKYISV
jgi:uncharacterized protein (DUF2336 family)